MGDFFFEKVKEKATGTSSGKQSQQKNEGLQSVCWPSCKKKNMCGISGIGNEKRCSKTETMAETSSSSHEMNIR